MDTKEQYDKIVENIKDVLETYVQPAVAGHGGKVNYLDYDNGAVTLEMSGACSGCAMSSMTLKMGIGTFIPRRVVLWVSKYTIRTNCLSQYRKILP